MAPTDDARKWTDAELDALEKRMRRKYTAAADEARGKLESAMRDFDRERIAREKALDDTAEAAGGTGLVLQSPNGTRWLVPVDDSGSLTTTAL